MRDINVDPEVFGMIWGHRQGGEACENDILKRLLAELQEEKTSSDELMRMKIQSQPSPKVNFKVRWVDDIVMALERLNGVAPLAEIYRVTRKIRKDAGRTVPATYDATIRRTLEDHSSDSANHRAEDLFKIVERGIWALR